MGLRCNLKNFTLKYFSSSFSNRKEIKQLNGFKERSRKFQTIVEVFYKLSSNIIINCDKDIIKQCISLFLINFEDYTQILPESVIDVIYKNSKLFLIHGKIHLSIIWVCVYDYSNNTESISPLIKIYKDETEKCALFIDVKGNVFMNWNHFLECAFLPTSHLCVPTNGKYTKMANSNLDLTYFFYEDVQNAFKKSGEQYLWPMNDPWENIKINSSLEKNLINQKVNQHSKILLTDFAFIQKLFEIALNLWENLKSRPTSPYSLISSFIHLSKIYLLNETSEIKRSIFGVVILLGHFFYILLNLRLGSNFIH